MPALNPSLSPRSLAEIAWVISRIGSHLPGSAMSPSVNSLREFWQSTRALEQRWSGMLAISGPPDDTEIQLLETLAPRVFLCETVVRLWGTILASHLPGGGREDLRLFARNAVGGLNRVRNDLLSLMLKTSDSQLNRLLELERLRRRCERWTDLMLGPIAIKGNCFEFANVRERARDFGEEGLEADHHSGPNAYEHLVSAGMRMMFMMHLSNDPVSEPEIADLVHSIVSQLPEPAFHRNGTARGLLLRRMAFDRQRTEGPGIPESSETSPILKWITPRNRRFNSSAMDDQP